MRTRGWNGSIPETDDEAVGRILDTAHNVVKSTGPKATLAAVSRELGVTRQTVYRYFDDMRSLLVALARREAGVFVTRLTEHANSLPAEADVVVETMLFAIEKLPHEQFLSIVLDGRESAVAAAAVRTAAAASTARDVAEQAGIDWSKYGVAKDEIDSYLNYLLRNVQTFLVDPWSPEGDSDGLREYLSRWVV